MRLRRATVAPEQDLREQLCDAAKSCETAAERAWWEGWSSSSDSFSSGSEQRTIGADSPVRPRMRPAQRTETSCKLLIVAAVSHGLLCRS